LRSVWNGFTLSLKALAFGRLSFSVDRKSSSQWALKYGKKLSIFALEESKNCPREIPFGLWKKLWKAEEPLLGSDIQVSIKSGRILFIVF
jgi:hypothetical protein